ncbi:30S ribosomal protein S20 [Candidatus Saccharibacteria bacterium]|nr:30S ribosomal protein S20 [Candidatus Saccharibacteria bacterium]
MPIIKSAKKAARQATKRQAKNQEIKKNIKLALKTFKSDPSAENMKKVQSEYDKAVKKGLLKKNTASRRKSRLAKIAKELTQTPVKKSASKTTKKSPSTTKKA